MVKVTFTLDETTIQRLNRAASQRSIPKSQVIREAIENYSAQGDRLSEAERQYKLRILREYMASPPTRSQEDVDRELAELRESRRHGWQRPSDL